MGSLYGTKRVKLHFWMQLLILIWVGDLAFANGNSDGSSKVISSPDLSASPKTYHHWPFKAVLTKNEKVANGFFERQARKLSTKNVFTIPDRQYYVEAAREGGLEKSKELEGPNAQFEDGSVAKPFSSISKCVNKLASEGGGTCLLQPGRYEESVKVPSNIMIKAAQGGLVGQSNGPNSVDSSQRALVSVFKTISAQSLVWNDEGNGVWSASVDLISNSSRLSQDDIQVLVDNVPFIEARWPNMGGYFNRMDNRSTTMSVAQNNTKMDTVMVNGKNRSVGTLYDSRLPGGVSLVGAVVHVQGNANWCTHTGVVYESGNGYIRYIADNYLDDPLMDPLKLTPGSPYFIDNNRGLLDNSNEFYYDRGSKVLYLKSPTGGNPSDRDIRVKMQEYALDFSGATNSGAAGLSVEGSLRTDNNSANIKLDSLAVNYVSHFVRNIYGPFAGYGEGAGVQIAGVGNTISNSVIKNSAGHGIVLRGIKHTVFNNSISYIDYSGSYSSGIFLSTANQPTEIQILNNTIKNTGRDAINYANGSVVPGQDRWKATGFQDSRIAYNDISSFGLMAADLGGLYICCNVDGARWSPQGRVLTRTSIDHNRVYNSQNSGIYMDNQTHGFAIHHNVTFNNAGSGVQLNGYSPAGNPGSNYDFTINSNTFFRGQRVAINVQRQDPGGLSNTYISANIFVTPPEARTGCGGGFCHGRNDFNSGGMANYYGEPGFVNSTISPYDFHLYGGGNNSCSYKAPRLWTDSFKVNTLCVGGGNCGNPVSPSYGAFNTGGYSAEYGAHL